MYKRRRAYVRKSTSYTTREEEGERKEVNSPTRPLVHALSLLPSQMRMYGYTLYQEKDLPLQDPWKFPKLVVSTTFALYCS